MKLVHSAPTAACHTTATAADRTFTLTPEAYAVILNLANKYDADTLAQTLDVALMTIDAMLLDRGLNKATAVVDYVNNVTHYRIQSQAYIPEPTILRSIR